MGNYNIFEGFENPRRGRQARNSTTNVPKILDLKSCSEQIISKNCRWMPLIGPEIGLTISDSFVAWQQKFSSFHSPRWNLATLNIIDNKNVLEDIVAEFF